MDHSSNRTMAKWMVEDLGAKHANFVIEYSKDFNPRRAAKVSGYEPDSGYEILKKPKIQEALAVLMEMRLAESHIDAQWVLYELVDNHRMARQAGNISASNTALGLVAKHAHVDAFAAERVITTSDKDIQDQLRRGRERSSVASGVPDFMGGSDAST